MAKRGGVRPGSGRKKGSKVRATIENRGTIGELARAHTEIALETLVRIATKSESDAAAVAASNSLLDRGYGKPSQAIEHTGKDGGPIQTQQVSPLDEIEARLAKLVERDSAGRTVN